MMNETFLVSQDNETFHLAPGEYRNTYCGQEPRMMLGRTLSWAMAPYCGIIYPREIGIYKGTCFECLVKYYAQK